MHRVLPFAAAGLLAAAAAAIAQEPAPPAQSAPAAPAAAQAVRPDPSPVVAVGCNIRWNVPYVEPAAAQQTLDVYSPAGAAGAAIVVFVHGGEWVKGDKAEVSFKPKFLNEQGVVFVSVNYRLSGVARHPAQVDDVAAAIRFVMDHAKEFGGDARRVFLLGHSAGSHLVTLVGLDPRPLAKVGLAPRDLAGIASWSGSNFDLAAKLKEGGENAPYIVQNFGDAEAGLRDASPVAHAQHGAAGPRFLFASAGQSSRPTSRAAAEAMAEQIRAAGGRAETALLPGKTHFTANYELGMPNGGEEIGEILLAFVRG